MFVDQLFPQMAPLRIRSASTLNPCSLVRLAPTPARLRRTAQSGALATNGRWADPACSTVPPACALPRFDDALILFAVDTLLPRAEELVRRFPSDYAERAYDGLAGSDYARTKRGNRLPLRARQLPEAILMHFCVGLLPRWLGLAKGAVRGADSALNLFGQGLLQGVSITWIARNLVSTCLVCVSDLAESGTSTRYRFEGQRPAFEDWSFRGPEQWF